MKDEYFGRIIKRDELKRLLRNKIIEGVYKPGDKLPSENEMSRTYGLCRNTIREAIASLAHEGLLTKSQGKGTFVAERRVGPLTFALIAPRLWEDGHGLAAQLFTMVDAEARANGAAVLLYLGQGSPDRERENLLDALNRRVDGVIYMLMGNGDNIDCVKRLMQAQIPLVMVDRYIPELPLDYVTSDNVHGARLLTERLAGAGCRRIAHITYSPDSRVTAVHERIGGYRDAMESHGLECDVRYTHERADECCAAVIESGTRRIADELDFDGDAPVGIFVATSQMLEPVLDAIDARGIPHDRVALATFDEPCVRMPADIRLAKAIQDVRAIGTQSVQLLMDRIDGNRNQRSLLLPPEIYANFG